MRALILLPLLAASAFAAEDIEGARDNFDTIVRGYFSKRAENDVWTLKRKKGAPLLLRYAEIDRKSVHPAGALWRGIAFFDDDATKKRYYADATVSMAGDLWEVKSFKWKTKAELPKLREEYAKESAEGPKAAPAAKPGREEALLAENYAAYYDPNRDAKADLGAAIALAKRTDKRVLLQVGRQGCSWCDKLKKFLEADPELAELRDRYYVTVLMDHQFHQNVWQKFGQIRGTPHFFVLGPDGALIRSQPTDPLENGPNYDREKLREFFTD